MHYEIQTRQKGAWKRWIGATDLATVERTWSGLNVNGRRGPAARLVQLADGKRPKIIGTKARVSHQKQR